MRNVMEVASHAVRGCVIAPPGKKLVIADLANIEGRIGAWLAGEEWKLQAFRDFDAGTGPDLYCLAYGKSFKVDPTTIGKKDPRRQVGKVQELMLQYEGGVGAFATGAKTYGIDLEELADTAYPTLPGQEVHDAERFLEWCREEGRPTYGMSDKAFVTCDVIKRLWRNPAHPMISSLWKDLKESVIAAIENPGETFECRKFKIRRDGAWLRIRLPSGRYLCYPSPKMLNGTITYMGVNQYTRKWQRLSTYGGKMFENACQALAGDILRANWIPIEEAGYELTFTVHDEDVTEAPDNEQYNAKHLSALIATVPDWAEGLPLAAAGFEAYRYRKD